MRKVVENVREFAVSTAAPGVPFFRIFFLNDVPSRVRFAGRWIRVASQPFFFIPLRFCIEVRGGFPRTKAEDNSLAQYRARSNTTSPLILCMYCTSASLASQTHSLAVLSGGIHVGCALSRLTNGAVQTLFVAPAVWPRFVACACVVSRRCQVAAWINSWARTRSPCFDSVVAFVASSCPAFPLTASPSARRLSFFLLSLSGWLTGSSGTGQGRHDPKLPEVHRALLLRLVDARGR